DEGDDEIQAGGQRRGVAAESLDRIVIALRDGLHAREYRRDRDDQNHQNENTEAVHQMPPAREPDLTRNMARPSRARKYRRFSRFRQSQPDNSRSATLRITRMPASDSLRQGIAAKFSPPC